MYTVQVILLVFRFFMEGKTVEIYTTPTCHFCHQAKEFMQANNVTFTEYDVAVDSEKREEMITKTGQMGVPVIAVGDDVMIGFDEDRLRGLLGLA